MKENNFQKINLSCVPYEKKTVKNNILINHHQDVLKEDQDVLKDDHDVLKEDGHMSRRAFDLDHCIKSGNIPKTEDDQIHLNFMTVL